MGMSPDSQTPDNNKNYGNILDFVQLDKSPEEFQIEIAVKDDGKVAAFYNRPFKKEISWVEFDMNAQTMDFISDGGDIRNLGLPVRPEIIKNIQNSHQILMILMDDNTGEAKEGYYVPIILHQI